MDGCAGQRRYLQAADDSDSEADEAGVSRTTAPEIGVQNALLVWRFEHDWLTLPRETQVEDQPKDADVDNKPQASMEADFGSQLPADDRVAMTQQGAGNGIPEEGELIMNENEVELQSGEIFVNLKSGLDLTEQQR